jgi:hypothetical protein
MLYGGFWEGQAQQAGKIWEVALPEDDPESLRVLLLAVHGNVTDIPKPVTRATLFRIVVACDKYDMMMVLRSYWSIWLRKIPFAHPDAGSLVQELWIAHKLGHRKPYQDALEKLILHAVKPFGDTRLSFEGCPRFNLYGDVYLESLDVMSKYKLRRSRLLMRWIHVQT